MALALSKKRTKGRDQVIAIDLGSRTTKAVCLQRRGGGYVLTRFTIQDAPIYEKNLSPDLLAEHLKSIMQALDAKSKSVVLSLGVADSILRSAELPLMPVPEMRLMLKYNSKNYLQQELPDHVFDCSIIPPKAGSADTVKEAGARGAQKFKVWVGAARNRLISDLQAGTKTAGLVAEEVTLSVLGPINAFEVAEPEVFANGVVALVDIGFKASTISIVAEGELMLSRVVGIGGDKLTTGLAESIGVTYAEAEGIKIGMPHEVETSLQPLLSPLGRELRASIDFFEHQHDKTVGQVYVSGGAAASEFILQNLHSELMVPCKSWDPTTAVTMGLPPEQLGQIEQVAPQLVVAMGTALQAVN
ncbi:MAG: pilus assembly protein PilM [Verrucomicrobia bacterium]|nr:pilus assembly protein PilM [Verrucomicrobiota bacterium]